MEKFVLFFSRVEKVEFLLSGAIPSSKMMFVEMFFSLSSLPRMEKLSSCVSPG